MSALLHVSDSHFGTEQPAVVEALLAFCHALKPEACVWSGDITQRARRAEFRAARAFRDRLNVLQTLIIPGNHDIPLFDLATRLFSPYRPFARVFGMALEPVIDTPRFLLIGVNTTRRFRHIQGAVSAAQIEQVSTRLRRARATQLRVVVTHQPFHVTLPSDETNLLRNAAAAASAWAQAGADLVLGGHIHVPFVRSLSARYPGLARDLYCVQAGTCVSHRTRNGIPNSFNVIHHLGARACRIERFDFQPSGRFELADETQLAAR